MGMSFLGFGQKNKPNNAISDEIRKNFDYDPPGFLSYINTTSGLYAIKFKINNEADASGFITLYNAYNKLQTLFILAIKKSISKKDSIKLEPGSYLQLIYFSNILYCNPNRDENDSLIKLSPDSSINFSENSNYDKEIIELLSSQLVSVEKSIFVLKESGFDSKEQICLPIAYINNENPNKKMGRSFRSDTKDRQWTKEEIEQLERKIQIERKKKRENKN